MFILLTVCHSFLLRLTYSQNFPGPEPLFQAFPVLKNQGLVPGFPEPARTLFNSKPCCIGRLISRSKQNCESLSYLPSPGDERLLRIGKVSVTASDVRNMHWGKNPYYISSKKAAKTFRNIEKFIVIGECTKTINLLKTLRLRYLQRSSVFAASFLRICLHFVLWLELSSPSKHMASNLWCKNTRNDS